MKTKSGSAILISLLIAICLSMGAYLMIQNYVRTVYMSSNGAITEITGKGPSIFQCARFYQVAYPERYYKEGADMMKTVQEDKRFEQWENSRKVCLTWVIITGILFVISSILLVYYWIEVGFEGPDFCFLAIPITAVIFFIIKTNLYLDIIEGLTLK